MVDVIGRRQSPERFRPKWDRLQPWNGCPWPTRNMVQLLSMIVEFSAIEVLLGRPWGKKCVGSWMRF